MKKILALISGLIAFAPVVASAQLQPNFPGGPQVSMQGLVEGILNFTWVVFGLIAIVCFVFSAVLFLTAQGDSAKITTARNSFLWGVAGIVVGIIAYSIIAIVGSFIT